MKKKEDDIPTVSEELVELFGEEMITKAHEITKGKPVSFAALKREILESKANIILKTTTKSVTQIAKDIGTSRQTVYRYFKKGFFKSKKK